MSSQLSDVFAGVVTRRPVRPQRFPEAWLKERGFGETNLLDEPDVERPPELRIAEDPAPRTATGGTARATKRLNAAGSAATTPYPAFAPQSWPTRTARSSARNSRRTSRSERTYVPALTGFDTGASYPGSHGATTRYPSPARCGPRCRHVCGVSGKPCTRTASGRVVSSMSPKVSGGGAVISPAYYI